MKWKIILVLILLISLSNINTKKAKNSNRDVDNSNLFYVFSKGILKYYQVKLSLFDECANEVPLWEKVGEKERTTQELSKYLKQDSTILKRVQASTKQTALVIRKFLKKNLLKTIEVQQSGRFRLFIENNKIKPFKASLFMNDNKEAIDNTIKAIKSGHKGIEEMKGKDDKTIEQFLKKEFSTWFKTNIEILTELVQGRMTKFFNENKFMTTNLLFINCYINRVKYNPQPKYKKFRKTMKRFIILNKDIANPAGQTKIIVNLALKPNKMKELVDKIEFSKRHAKTIDDKYEQLGGIVANLIKICQ